MITQQVITINISPDELGKLIEEKVCNAISNNIPVTDRLLTCGEIEKKFQIDPSTRVRWTKSGTLKAYAIKGRLYYKDNEANEALTEV